MIRSHTNLKGCRRRTGWILASTALAGLGGLASGCAKQQAAPQPRPPIPVIVGTVIRKAMPVEVVAVGNVEAHSTGSIKAQVSGQLMDGHFKQVAYVRKGTI